MPPVALTDASAIERIVTRHAECWNRHDIAGIEESYSPNADFVNVLGRAHHGRAPIVEELRWIHAGIMRNSRLTIQETRTRFLRPDVAIAHVAWEMTGAEGLPGWEVPPVRRGVLTFVLTVEGGDWRIAAGHNTDVVPLQ